VSSQTGVRSVRGKQARRKQEAERCGIIANIQNRSACALAEAIRGLDTSLAGRLLSSSGNRETTLCVREREGNVLC
jgi:hypothetical protein